MIERKEKPQVNNRYQLSIPKPEILQLDNGIEVFLVKGEGLRVVRLDLMWNGGRSTEVTPALARSSMQCLMDGTNSVSSHELSEFFDFCGCSVAHRSSMEHLHSSISFLIKDLKEVVPTFLRSIFRWKGDEMLLSQRQHRFAERLSAELSKNSVIAYRELTEQLYGTDHLYGYSTQPDDYRNVTLKEVKDYLGKHISTESCKAIICGDLSIESQGLILKELAMLPMIESRYESPIYHRPEEIKSDTHRIEGTQHNQVTIRLGRRVFARDHEDSDHLRLANIVLGGYFGSRLMTKIREEKGYCYHIDSSVDLLAFDGYISISAEVNSKYVKDCVTEIKNELRHLMKECVPNDELDRVKQYIRGQFLLDSDGVFATGNLIRRYLAVGKDETEFIQKLEVLDKTTAEDIRSVANKYFDPAEYTMIIVGDISNNISA